MSGDPTMRLSPQPGEVIDRGVVHTFRWNGRVTTAYRGDTIVSALAAAGERVFSRSFKYHRPRGVLSADQHDPNCLVQVGDVPNMPGAHILVHDGISARSQNTWPSLRFDAKAVNGLLAPYLGAGFYYKTFMSPRSLRGVYQRVLARFSPGGQLSADTPRAEYSKRFIFYDVVVAGGGPAGMAAAIAAAEAGDEVLLVDEGHQLGGHLRWGGGSELAVLTELRDRVAASPNIEVLLNAVVVGVYDQNWVAVHERGPSGGIAERLLKGRPRRLIVATGLLERPYLCDGNDVAGVMLPTAVRRLVCMYAVRPGHRAVIVAGDPADDTAQRLEAAGVEVVVRGTDVRRVIGRGGVRAVQLSGGRRVEADLVVASAGWSAQTGLWTMAGGTLDFDHELDRFVPAGPVRENVAAVGGLVGDTTLARLIDDAMQVGRGLRTGGAADPAPDAAGGRAGDAAGDPARRPVGGTAVVDFSEDVSVADLEAAVAEGYRSIELAKRYTTATMGPTQGKYAAINAAAVLGAANGRSIEQTGTPTARPPYSPISLGALAGRRFHPVRYTPMHAWHVSAGAELAPAGQWLRPQHYGDPVAEARAVRTGVGIIDVSTLGKFELSGSEVPRLLNALYVNRWSTLAVGSVRYGAMCDEAGIVVDDGVTGRISESRYIMSATSSGAGNVARAIEVYLQTVGADWDVALTDVTDAYASVNVAGPRARTLLSRLAESVDLSDVAFGYMRVREARIAGVEGCFMWRIGFTGEVSYEIHIPAGYGLHVWQRLVDAGEDLDVTPFGVEAQRILRIEKGHAVVGQDSDALTGPYSLGLGGMTRLDKTETVGAPELAWQAAHPDRLPYVLVSLQPDERSLVPPESSQVLVDGTVVGRVTSSCWSPTLQRAIALAQLRPDLAVSGTEVEIRRIDGGRAAARVQPGLAHVDPEGVRLRG